MNLAQGNTRSMPDGFLHIQNFTVTKHAGMAAVVYTHILDENQRETLVALLIEKASQDNLRAIRMGMESAERYHVRHGTVRFAKWWLKENFQKVVHEYTKVIGLPVANEFLEKLIAERESL